jgi:hypothetical protein
MAEVVGLGMLSDDTLHGYLLHKRGDTLHLAWYGEPIVSPSGHILQTLEQGRIRASISVEIFSRVERVFLEEAWLRMKGHNKEHSISGFKLTYPWPISSTLGKELAVLLWAAEPGTNLPAVRQGWIDLHCTERWWLYQQGEVRAGWRRAIQAALGAL